MTFPLRRTMQAGGLRAVGITILLAFVGAWNAGAQDRIAECGNDLHFKREVLPLYLQQSNRFKTEYQELVANRQNVDWSRVTQLRRKQIEAWHQWERDTRKANPRWAAQIDFARNEELRIKYETNEDYLYYHEKELRAHPSSLVSARATVSTFLPSWVNEPYSLNPDPANPEKNRAPREGADLAYGIDIHFPNACLIERMEFELVGVPREQMKDGAELELVYITFGGTQVYTKWENGKVVGRPRGDVRYRHPFGIGIHRHKGAEWFAVQNVKVYGWTLDSFPFEVEKKPLTEKEVKDRAVEWCIPGKNAGRAMAIAMDYLVKNHITAGMQKSVVETMLGPAVVVDSVATYQAKDIHSSISNKTYAMVRVRYNEDRVQKIEYQRLIDESQQQSATSE